MLRGLFACAPVINISYCTDVDPLVSLLSLLSTGSGLGGLYHNIWQPHL